MKKLCMALWAGSALTVPAFLDAGSVYTIQLGAFQDEKSALETVEKYSSTTSSAFLRSDPKNSAFPYKVGFGEFSSYMDAWATKNFLEQELPPRCFIDKVSQDTLQSQKDEPGRTAVFEKSVESEKKRIPSAYVFKNLNSSARTAKGKKEISDKSLVSVEPAGAKLQITDKMLQTTVSKMSRNELVATGFHGSKNSSAISSLEEFLKRFPQDTEADAVRLRLARRLMARREFTKAQLILQPAKQNASQELRSKVRLVSAYAEASQKGSLAGYKACEEIVNDASVDEEIRLHAMRLAAGHAHASNNLTTATLIFKQLEETALSREEQLEASLQRCGLMFELAGRGKGTWEETREYCKTVMDSPEASKDVRATAGLIAAETLVNDRLLTSALSMLETLVRDNDDFKRVQYTADVLRGIVLCRLGQEKESEQIFQRFISLKMLSSEKFKGNEPDAQSLLWLAWIANNKNDVPGRDSYLSELKKRYPKSLQLKKAEKLYGITGEILTTPSL